MALDSTRLKDALKPQIETQIRTALALGATPYPELTKFADALAIAISSTVIAEITANATLSDAKFSGTYGVVGSTVSITNQPVTGGIA